MFARNAWRHEFGTRVAFADLGGPHTAWTADRTEFLGRNGVRGSSGGARARQRLSGRVGAGLDPCGALQATIGAARSTAAPTSCSSSARRRAAEQARALIVRYRSRDVTAVLRAVAEHWDERARHGAGQDAGPLDGHPAQPLAAVPDAGLPRVGAVGVLSGRRRLRISRPAAGRAGARRRRARAGARSTCCVPRRGSSARATSSTGGTRPAGAASARGSPTTCSGCRTSSLATSRSPATAPSSTRSSPSSTAPSSPPAQRESYFEPRVSEERGTLFEHCARALDHSLTVGAHGLPLMGTGDWNDGMNAVGAEGKGESVWLGWFLHAVLSEWADAGRRARRGQAGRAVARARERRSRTSLGTRGLGRRLVPTRVLRRRDAARLGRQRRVPDRFDRAVLERDLGGRRSGTPGAAMAAVDAHLVRRADGLVLAPDAAVRRHAAGARLHQGLRPRGPRERRAVHARGGVVGDRLRGARRRGQGRRALRDAESDQPRPHRARTSSATRSSPTSSRRTSTPSRRTSAAAAGRGTRARRRGCTGRGSSRSSGSGSAARSS